MFRRAAANNENSFAEAFATDDSAASITSAPAPVGGGEPEQPGDWESDYEGELAVDVYETPEELIVKAPIAGVAPHQLDIQINEHQLTIRGEREDMHQLDADNVFFQECYWGTFSRVIPIPIAVRPREAKASIKHGLLTIRLPKEESAKRHRVPVEVEE